MSAGTIVMDTWDQHDGAGEGQISVGTQNGGWTQYAGTFNSGTNEEVKIRVFTQVAITGSAYIDNIVLEEESPPFITSTPPMTVDVQEEYSYTVTTVDLNGDPITISGVNIPSWLDFNEATGVLSGVPSNSKIGDHPVELQASDGSNVREQSFTIRVTIPGNNAPTIDSSAPTGLNEYDLYHYPMVASDVDGDPLTFIETSVPSWMSLDATGYLSGVPTSSDTGVHSVTVSVSDGQITTDQTFDLMVFEIPDPVSNLVPNGSFENGSTSWTLGNGADISSADSQDGGSSLRVYQTSSATWQNVTVVNGVTYNLSVWINAAGLTAEKVVFDTQDEYDDTCQFVVTSGTGWTRYTGSFTATDTSVKLRVFATSASFAGTVYVDNIVIEPASSAITVAPVFTSTPVLTAEADHLYKYAIDTDDGDSENLTLSGLTIPSWLTLVELDGDVSMLTGVPESANVGSHPVTLQVSDGQNSTNQSFSISVSAATFDPGYDAWANSSGAGAATADADGDGRNNLYEYALNGDPDNSGNKGVDPIVVKEGAAVKFIHQKRNDDANLVYTVELTTNLVTGTWASGGTSVIGTDVQGGGTFYDVVTNSVPATDPQSYIRLKILNQ